jgi:hypothetical protein
MSDTEDSEPMTKEGVVRKGRTPSVVSGKPSDEVRRDKEAYAKGERTVDTVEDLAEEM